MNLQASFERVKNKFNVSYELIGLLAGLGAVVGVLAGLLGIGGGLLVVPALLFLLPKAGIPQSLQCRWR